MTDTPHIATYTGRLINCLEPQSEDIDIGDIAHALSLLCRFNGHCQRFYSVAEHSVRVSVLAQELADGEGASFGDRLAERLEDLTALLGLMHDAAEAYPPGDLVVPQRNFLEGAIDVQSKFDAAIRMHLDPQADLSPEAWKCVEKADKMLLAWEWRDIMGRDPMWEIPAPHTTQKIQPWTSTSAELRFLLRFQRLVPDYPLADTIKRLLPMPEPAMMSKSMCTGAARDETIRLHLVLGEAKRAGAGSKPLVHVTPDVQDEPSDAREEAEQIGFSVQIAGEQVEVAVPDTGPPTAADMVENINTDPEKRHEPKQKKKRKKRRKKRKKNGFSGAMQTAIDQAVAQALGTADITPKRGSPGSAENPREVPEQKSLKPTKAERRALADPELREEAFGSLPDRPETSGAGGVSFSRRPG